MFALTFLLRRKNDLISNFVTSQPGLVAIAVNILPYNISRRKKIVTR